MTILPDYSPLSIPAEIVRAICDTSSAIESINVARMRENARIYSATAHTLLSGDTHISRPESQLNAAWHEQGKSVISLPSEKITRLNSCAQTTASISHRLEHIAYTAQLAQCYCAKHLEKLNHTLARLQSALMSETHSTEQNSIRSQAVSLATLTSNNLDTIARRYLSTLSDDVAGPLAMNLEHLPPLWGPTGDPNPTDIDQGGFGDCFLHASLGAMSLADPQYIHSNIIEDPQHPGSYIVTLFSKDNGERMTQHISAQELHNNLKIGQYDERHGQVALWPMIAEAAYAKFLGNGDIIKGDNQIYFGGYLEPPIQALTGRKVVSLSATEALTHYLYPDVSAQTVSQAQIIHQVSTALAQHRPVAMGTFIINDSTDAPTFVSNGNTVSMAHAYMVLGLHGDTITIRDPYGHNSEDNPTATVDVKVSDLIKHNAEFVVGQ